MFSFHHLFLLLFSSVFIVDSICSLHHCFFTCFLFHHQFSYCFLSVFISLTFFTVTVFCPVLYFFYWSTTKATDLRVFFNLRPFLPYSPSRHLAQPPFIKAFLEPAVQPWRFQGLSMRFKTQIRPVCLYESLSVQQKVLDGRFYLYIKDLQNTLTASSRFWTH